MKALVLAGGFARRLGGAAENTPKALIPLHDNKPVIEYLLEKLEEIDGLQNVFISTNAKFKRQFQEWLERRRLRETQTGPKAPLRLDLVTLEAKTEEEKRGPVRTVQFVVDQEKIREDLLVVAGDNLFDFALGDFVRFASKKRAVTLGAYDVGSADEAKKMGVLEIDSKHGRVTEFEEKPKYPKSTLVSLAVYFFPQDSLNLIGDYLGTLGQQLRPGPGELIQWLAKENHKIYAFVFDGTWIDIGSPESLERARKAVANWR